MYMNRMYVRIWATTLHVSVSSVYAADGWQTIMLEYTCMNLETVDQLWRKPTGLNILFPLDLIFPTMYSVTATL